MSGNQMDTTCSAIVNDTYVSCVNQSISDLTGIQYFDSLRFLNCYLNLIQFLPHIANSDTFLSCSHNQLINLTNLPNSLHTLYSENNELTNLPSIPSSLKELNCSYNYLTSLPNLPSTLQALDCSGNQLTSLPALPNSLSTLNCSYNTFNNLPALPNSLINLECANAQLTSLPLLPISLYSLKCSGNQLTGLPLLPSNLTHLECGHNIITSLPPLPNSLTYLYCEYNSLTNLPFLPNSLWILSCSNNQLTDLPSLPDSILSISCNNNPIECFPYLLHFMGGTSSSFKIYNTLITCLPNMINHNGYIASIDTMPICNQGNSNGCPYCVSDSTFSSTEICNGDSILISNVWETSAGIYQYHLSSATSCDSLIIITLSVHSINAIVNLIGDSILVQTLGAVQWYDCNSHQIISGATQNIFVPSVSGIYAAIITEGNCTDTSNCFQVFTGINLISNNSISFSLYPNPTSQNITIEFHINSSGTFSIYNLLGEKQQEINLDPYTTKKNISLTNLASGLYFCVVRDADGNRVQQKLVVEK